MPRNFQNFEIEITHVRGSGPGGQNRNKRWTGVRIVHLPTGTTVIATERRSQSQNLSAALERLEERLEKLFQIKKTRIKTKPTRSSSKVRLESKHKQGLKKSMRKFDSED